MVEGEQIATSPTTLVTINSFRDCTIFCPNHLMDVIVSAGAKLHDVVDERLTHYIVHDRVLSKEHQDALQALTNVKVVNDDWIRECIEAGEKLEEEPFLLNFSSSTTPKSYKISSSGVEREEVVWSEIFWIKDILTTQRICVQ